MSCLKSDKGLQFLFEKTVKPISLLTVGDYLVWHPDKSTFVLCQFVFITGMYTIINVGTGRPVATEGTLHNLVSNLEKYPDIYLPFEGTFEVEVSQQEADDI